MKAEFICKACGTIGSGAAKSPSNFIVELLVWIGAIALAVSIHWVILLAAIGFTLWRFTGRKKSCDKCGSSEMIPADTPLGRQVAEQARAQQSTQ